MLAVAEARVANAWLRLSATGVAALVATSVIGNISPLIWFAAMAAIIVLDRSIFERVARSLGRTPLALARLVSWVVFQSSVGNVLAALLWFAPYVPGNTLAVMYLMGGVANAATTLRMSTPLALAGVTPTLIFLLCLPLLQFALGGAANALDLMPFVGGLVLLGYGISLWKSLLASDAAQARAEAAVMRERQAALAAAAAKTDTIQRMNDELRTPMAALAGAAEHLSRAAVSPEARRHIATLVQANEVLKLVLDDLSDLDALENGQLRICNAAADPREILRGVVAAFKTAATDKNLELFVDVQAATPVRVQLDAVRVRQVLFNLLANAIRYTAHGGVRIRLGVQDGAAPGRVKLTFIVADTGQGMSRAQLAMIFGRERVAANGEGPGLGLSISLRLARLMGGQLVAKSDLGQGSVFTFSLDAPVVAASAAA
ncbi:MAG: HAMP domain-containing sensor histidine kinase [Terricaulis sp.]